MKWLLFPLAFIAVFSFSSCGEDGEDVEDSPESSNSEYYVNATITGDVSQTLNATDVAGSAAGGLDFRCEEGDAFLQFIITEYDGVGTYEFGPSTDQRIFFDKGDVRHVSYEGSFVVDETGDSFVRGSFNFKAGTQSGTESQVEVSGDYRIELL